MKLAIHHVKDSFSEYWIKYCVENKIPFEIVNVFDNNIIEILRNFTHFFWHWNHLSIKDKLIATSLIKSLENLNIKVFPDFNTCWHFDNKISQKYLLESIEAPLINTFIYYNKNDYKMLSNLIYPIVCKLKIGAGSNNVSLIKNKYELKSMFLKMFKSGRKSLNIKNIIKDNYKKIRFNDIGKIYNFLINKYFKYKEIEYSYVYLQKFLPGLDHDIRVVIIGNKAFAIKRIVRNNDFRASGSGYIIHDEKEIDINYIKMAFKINENLNCQSVAFDFVMFENKIYLIEISYAFTSSGYNKCPGYWDKDLNFIYDDVIPEKYIIQSILN